LRLLLDTHIWIWRLLEPERLSSGLSKVLSVEELIMATADRMMHDYAKLECVW